MFQTLLPFHFVSYIYITEYLHFVSTIYLHSFASSSIHCSYIWGTNPYECASPLPQFQLSLHLPSSSLSPLVFTKPSSSIISTVLCRATPESVVGNPGLDRSGMDSSSQRMIMFWKKVLR